MPHPWSFKAAIAMFVVFGAGAVLIAFACFESRWQALRHFARGVLTAGVGLVGGLLFLHHLCGNSATCRRQFLFAGGLALLVVAGLVLFARVA